MTEKNNSELLKSIQSPKDLRKLPKEKLPQLAREVRDVIIETVSEKGGMGQNTLLFKTLYLSVYR